MDRGSKVAKEGDSELKKVCREFTKTALEINHGIMVEIMKSMLFTKTIANQ